MTPIRSLARRVAGPVQAFAQLEAASGIVLVAAAAVALAWASSPWHAAYESIVGASASVHLGGRWLSASVEHVVNDGLMSLFFLVVALEIKREWVAGELRDRRAAALPAIAAVGGMVVPALLYVAVTAGGDGSHGWGIPMATDIAFALGVVALLGRRVPPPLKVFLLTLAIVDDIGAIVVIAAFYSGPLALGWLVAAVVVVLAVVALRALGVRSDAAYVVLGLALWWCAHRSGIHATIAGVTMGLLAPAAADPTSSARPVTDRLIGALHPWTTFAIVPAFAVVNAGIRLDGDALDGGRTVALAVVVGLVVGKAVGISLFSWLAIRLGLGVAPAGVRFRQLVALATVAGVGFTVSLFVADLAFDDASLLHGAKVGIVAASVLAATIGATALALTSRGAAEA